MIPTVTIWFASNWVASRWEPGGKGGMDTLARLFPMADLALRLVLFPFGSFLL